MAAAQQAQPQANFCDSVVGMGDQEAADLKILCKEVVSASGGKEFSTDLAKQVLNQQKVKFAFGQLRVHKQDELKRKFAVRQLQMNAAKDAATQFKNAVTATTQNRPDQQTTAEQTVNAATSLVQKVAGPELISFALETGALTQSSTASNATLSGNLEGVFYTLVGQDPVCFTSCDSSALRKVLGHINASATFTLNQQSGTTTSDTAPANGTSPPAGTAVSVPSSVGRFSGIGAKFRILNRFDPRDPRFQKKWKAAVLSDTDYDKIAIDLMKVNGPISASIEKVDDESWPEQQVQMISAILTKDSNFSNQYESYASGIYEKAPIGSQDLSTYLQNYSKLAANWAAVRDSAAGTLATLEYSYAKPADQPEVHTITAVLSYAPKDSTANGLFTANLGTSFYGGTIPADAKYGRLRYGQASAEFDRILFSPTNAGPVNLNLAAYWQYQPDPSVLNIDQTNVAPGTTIPAPTQVLVGTAGSLWVVQGQLQYKTKTGLSIPFGVKWSNKTELLTGNKVGAQVGISYDFSFLSKLLNPGAQ